MDFHVNYVISIACQRLFLIGQLKTGDIARLNAVFRKAVRLGALLITCVTFQISSTINTQTRLLKQIFSNSDHCLGCLHHLLPERKFTGYSLRKRGYEFQLSIVSTSLFKKSLLIDFLYRHR